MEEFRVAPDLLVLGSLLPASRPGRPFRRAAVPLGKFRFAPILGARKRPCRRPCWPTSAWSVDRLWTSPGWRPKGE